MPLNLESLTLLELIESRGSFAAAAMAMNKAPSAITYQLRQLEESLDLLIYDRSGHKARLTPAGKVLLEEGRRLLQASETVRQKVKAVASGWEPQLHIVLDAIVPFDAIAHLVSEFYELESPTQLRFFSEVLSGTWEALLSSRANLLVGSRVQQSHFASSAGLNIHTIGKGQFVFAVSPKHPLADATEPICASTVAQYRAVAVGDTSRQFKPLTFGIQDGQAVLTVPDLQAKIQAQASGLGCGWVPLHFARPWIDSGQLIIKEVEDRSRDSEFCVAWHKGHEGRALDWWSNRLRNTTLKLQA